MLNFRLTRSVAALACGLAVSAALYGLWSSPAQANSTASLAGAWAIRLDVHAGGAPEHNIGVLDLQAGGKCTLRLRSNFGGTVHDHEAASCEWKPPDPKRPALDGSVTVGGIAVSGDIVISFVVADSGKRLLLLLDDTSPGVVGTGEAFRR